jgi:hypothetical protein
MRSANINGAASHYFLQKNSAKLALLLIYTREINPDPIRQMER